MRRFLFIILPIFIGILCSTKSYAIEEEPLSNYEKARLELASTTIGKILESQSGSSLEALSWVFLLNDLLEDKDTTTPRGSLEALEEILADLAGVTSFLPGDALNNLNIRGNFRYILEEYAKALKELEEGLTEEELTIERQKVMKRATFTKIERLIRNKFAQWNKKQETEKTANYETRLKERSRFAFDSICQKVLDEHWSENLMWKKGEYDADNEMLSIKFYYEDKNKNEICAVWYDIALPPEYVNDFRVSNVRIIEEGTYNNYLFPIKILYSAQYRHFYGKSRTDDVTPLVIEFDKLGIDNPYLSGVSNSMSFDAYYQWGKQLTDSINFYNLKIKEHPYFFNHKISHSNCLKFLLCDWQSKCFMSSYYAIDCWSGRKGIYNSWEKEKYKLHPSKEAYEEFLGYIRLFYQESKDFYDAVQEARLLLFGPLGYTRDSEFIELLSLCPTTTSFDNDWRFTQFIPIDRIKYGKSKNSQLHILCQFSKAKSSYLRSIYTQMCDKIIMEEGSTLSKDYAKYKQYFTTPVDFIDAYIVSGDFNAILRERKAKME